MKGATLARNAALSLGSILGTLLLAEGVLRIALPAPPKWTYPQESYLFDAETAHRLAPSQRAFTHDKPVETNSQGLRDREFPEAPSESLVRVLAIGDSQTFGNGLFSADTWPKQLEAALNKGPKKWEVLNAGVPGTDTWQHEIFLRRLTRTYHPQVAIVAVYPNDVSRTFTPDPASALPTNSTEKRLGYVLKRSTVCLLFLSGFRGALRWWEGNEEAVHEHDALTGTPDEFVEEAWHQVERSISGMKSCADENHVELLVVVIPRRDEVTGAERGRAFQKRVRAIADANGISCVDPLGALEQEYRRSGDAMFLAWDGHNTKISNAVIAGELAEALASR